MGNGLFGNVARDKVQRRVDAAQRDDRVAQPAADFKGVDVVALVVDNFFELATEPIPLFRRRNKPPLLEIELVPVDVRLLLVAFCASDGRCSTEDVFRKKAHDWMVFGKAPLFRFRL